MAEKSMNELRDEVAVSAVDTLLHYYFQSALSVGVPTPPLAEICRQAFELAEAFLAVRYDVLHNNVKKTPLPLP